MTLDYTIGEFYFHLHYRYNNLHFGLSAFNHGVSNLISPRKALAAKQLPESVLPALNGFSVSIIGIGIYYMLAAYQENRGFFALTLTRFITARIFWLQGPPWRVIAKWEAFSAGLTAAALFYESYWGRFGGWGYGEPMMYEDSAYGYGEHVLV
ncbi:hypothetical protein FMUND_12708 [Fusarium mundagurra]|uniref:Uncharacterized protein n=1 Tax=Fusarium mundagurra TaxID=1567541 RepID=A0A8H6D673_9HYPO|nr:hypothetical protein FMUND_12708 [Fusarium mundagurra]